MNIIKKILIAITLVIAGTILWAASSIYLIEPYLEQRGVSAFMHDPENRLPVFEETNTGFVHKYDGGDSVYPMVDIIALDTNGDGVDEFLMSGGAGQDNALLKYADGVFSNVISGTGLSEVDDATYGFDVGDLDGDGDMDVVAARQDGVYLYINTNGKFVSEKVEGVLADNAVPLDVAVADTTGDGAPEIFVSTFLDSSLLTQGVFNDPANRVRNAFLINDGEGNFSDNSERSGLGLNQNTFLARFADLNNDQKLDLIISPNTDQARVYQNNGDGTFTPHILTGYGFWMGLAIADFNSDGKPDIYLSNAGNTIPAFLVGGDLKEDQRLDLSYRLLINEGDFNFTDKTAELGLDTNVFGWGATAGDFNNDGRMDIVVTENYIKLPLAWHALFPNPGKMMLQSADGKFVESHYSSGVSNRYFGYTPLATDIDGDGKTDLFIANQNGPLRAFLNTSHSH